MNSKFDKTKFFNEFHQKMIDKLEADTDNSRSKILAQMMRDGLSGNKDIADIMDRMLEAELAHAISIRRKNT
jgi:hypothetical protein